MKTLHVQFGCGAYHWLVTNGFPGLHLGEGLYEFTIDARSHEELLQESL